MYRDPKDGEEDILLVMTLLCVPVKVPYISTDLEAVAAI